MTETLCSGVGESSIQCPDSESGEGLIDPDNMAANSNCGSLGPKSTENDNPNVKTELVEQIPLPTENGAATSSVDYLPDTPIEFPPEPDAIGSYQEHKKPEIKSRNTCSEADGMTLSSEYEATKKRAELVIVESGNDFLRAPQDHLTLNFSSKNFGFPPQNEGAISVAGHSAEPSGDASINPGHRSREPCKNANDNPMLSECEEKGVPEPLGNWICTPKTDACLTRVLRPRTHKKTKSPVQNNNAGADSDNVNNNNDNNNNNNNNYTIKKKEKQKKHLAVDEFSRIRAKLRYLLHRIKYEQNLIDAYSAEGWKGKSLEKIKPEKELQRAKTGISTYKLKIRDLFQRIDMLLAQGRLPGSSFDSEGLIDSEDIFCAKCGSKDLPADNDIILCDGACERGFHQFCLEPPLLKADIPPGDESWLCPGCVCKLDCFGLLNDLQGTNLSLTHTWEKVFLEEAATATSGKKLDEISGLPSDDSEDDDYNPDDHEVEENVSEDESSSEESDSFSASDDLAAPIDDQVMGLPSEDSEDEDYDPDAPDHDAQVMQESSSSDFTSDSEDVEMLDDKKLHDGIHQSTSPDPGDKEYGCTAPKRKNRSNKTMNTNFSRSENESGKRLKIVVGLMASEQGSSSKKNSKTRYGEEAIKRLFESFKENQYLNRDVKKNLAAELGLTTQQVSKWFENARRGFHDSSTSQARNQT